MIVFSVAAAILTLLVVVWMVRALLRPARNAGVSSQRLNAAIYRDQLQVLERDLARGAISPADYHATQDELQLRLLDDTADPEPTSAPAKVGFLTPRRSSAIVALLLPLGAAGMYAWLGAPSAIDPAATQAASNDKILRMVESLAARLKADPSDTKGWAMLARSYKVMDRLEEAEQAFIKAGDVVNNDAGLLIDYADLLAARSNSIEGKPLELVNRALQLDPLQPTGLMMSAIGAYQRADYPTAIAQWEKLLPLLEPNSSDAQQVENNIAEARKRTAMPAGEGAVTQEKINEMVQRLADRLQANPDDLAGWTRLARAYKVQGKLEQSEQAYSKAAKLVETDPNLLTQYADLLAMRAGNNLEGKPLTLVTKALAINPKHPQALMMAGSAAFRRADYAVAIRYWETALTVLEPGTRDAVQVAAEIANARSKQ